jgi:putative transposase
VSIHAVGGRAGARAGDERDLEEPSLSAVQQIDERVGVFVNRPLEGDWPYLWIDATYVKVREAGRIVSVALIIAVAVNTDGIREVLGLAVGPSEAEPFWTTFLRGLTQRPCAGSSW